MAHREHDSFDRFIHHADNVLHEMGKSESVRHLRRSGAELLKAVRCGLDGAIQALEPKHEAAKAEPPKPAE
jgi:hypothetical protein